MALLLMFFSTGVLAYAFSFFLARYSKAWENVGLAVAAAVVCAATVLSFKMSFPFMHYGVFPLLIGGWGLSCFALKKGRVPLCLALLGVCSVVACFFPNDFLIFQGFLPLMMDRTIGVLLWTGFAMLFAEEGKKTIFGLLQAQAVCIGFFAISLLYRMLPFQFLIPYSLIVVAALSGYVFIRIRVPFIQLGESGALFLGFLLGGFFFISAGLGVWSSVIVMPFFIYMEAAYTGIQKIKERLFHRPFQLSYFKDFLELEQTGGSSFLMKRMLILAFLGVMVQGVDVSVQKVLIFNVFCLVVIGIDTVMRIQSWGQPKPRIRDLFRDIKGASKAAYEEAKKNWDSLRNRPK